MCAIIGYRKGGATMNSEILIIIERLKTSIEKSNISYAELERRTGTAKSSIHRYATGETQKIPVDFIVSVAPHLGVTPQYLMGWEDENTEIPANDDRDSEIVGMFSELTDEEKKSVLDYISFVLSKRSDS